MVKSKRWKAAFGLLAVAVALFGDKPASAQIPVSIELVLAVDTSLSVNDIEFALQMQGIAQAFRSPEVIDLIGQQNGVAVALVQWAGWDSAEEGASWRFLKDPVSILSYADEIEATKRENVGYFTAIGTAIEAALHAIATNVYDGNQLKIDVSGDGENNAGPLPAESKELARTRGVTINGLAILTDIVDLDDYFRRQVITGPAAFSIKAADYEDFSRAFRIKLRRELAPAISQIPRKPSGATWPFAIVRVSSPAAAYSGFCFAVSSAMTSLGPS